MNTKAVIFDLDGTLLDTLGDLASATAFALTEIGLPAISVDRVRDFVGNGVGKLIERAIAFASTGEVDKSKDYAHDERYTLCLKRFTEYYDAHNTDTTALYDGVEQALDALKAKGVKLAVNTNKYDGAAQALKARYFPQVDFAVGASDRVRSKPFPDGAELALSALGVDKAHAVYVGDSETDIATAKNAGLPVVAVSWGFRDRAVLEKLLPDLIIDKPSQLLAATERIFERAGRAQ